MNIEKTVFKHSKIDLSKLNDFGFKKSGDKWVYNKYFMDNNFKTTISVDNKGNISGEVFEIATNDIFLPLRIESMNGFALKVREAYINILEDIKSNCCQINYFSHQQANRLALLIYKKYGDIPSFPWEKFKGYGVFKNPSNNKWYALIANIDKNKLNNRQEGETEIINLKITQTKIPDLIKRQGFYPAYHMNKKNWITAVLDDTIDNDFLFSLIEESHSFTLGKNHTL